VHYGWDLVMIYMGIQEFFVCFGLEIPIFITRREDRKMHDHEFGPTDGGERLRCCMQACHVTMQHGYRQVYMLCPASTLNRWRSRGSTRRGS
jgi:hypothetical protein